MVMANMQPELAWIVSRSDFPHLFQFRFSKEGMAHTAQNRHGSDLDGLAKHIWSGSKSVCRNHQARLLAGRNRPATSFPLSDPARLFHRRSRIILCKTSPGLIQFWLTVSGLGQTDPVRKQSGVQESSGPLLASVSQPIRTGRESDPACLPGSDAGAVFTCVCTLILICPRHVSQGS